MKFLFLDCDGVLNCGASFIPKLKPTGEIIRAHDPIDPEKMLRLNEIIYATGCKIVISSAWRAKMTLEELRIKFAENHFTGTIVGVTPRNRERIRGEEIADWLSNWMLFTKEPLTGIVALDDSDLWHGYKEPEEERSAIWMNYISLIKENTVKTSLIDGLQDRHVDECIKKLNGFA